MKLYMVGGGGCLIRNFADYDRNRTVINEDICATAKGYEYMALVTLNIKCGANIKEKRNRRNDLHKQGRSLTVQATKTDEYHLRCVSYTVTSRTFGRPNVKSAPNNQGGNFRG